MSKRKKIILIIILIIAILAIGLAVYYFFFLPKPSAPPVVPPSAPEIPSRLTPSVRPTPTEVTPVAPPSPVPPTPSPAAPLPIEKPLPEISLTPETGKDILVESLTDKPASGATAAADGVSAVYYDKEEGKFYKVAPTGEKTQFSQKSFYEVEKVDWSPNKKEAILEYPDGSKIFYNFEQEKQVTLPSNWYDFSFSPAGDQIAFMTDSVDPMDKWLAIANPDGSGTRALEHAGDNADKVQVSWSPNNQIVATSRTGEPLDGQRQEILMIGFHGENYKAITVEGSDFQSKWSPRGDKLLYSVYSGRFNYNPNLWIVDAQGDQIGSNNLYLGVQTWVEKCVFNQSGTTVYCAVPQNLPDGSGLLRELAQNSNDAWYKIDIETGLKTALANPTSYNAVDPFLSDDETYLYFTDKNTSLLHKINLK